MVFLLDWAITGRLVKLLEGREKLVAACGAGLAVLACAALILALNWTGAWTFTGETPFYRTVKLDAGTYQVSADWEGAAPEVRITARSRQDALMNRDRELYTGPLEGAEFTLLSS